MLSWVVGMKGTDLAALTEKAPRLGTREQNIIKHTESL